MGESSAVGSWTSWTGGGGGTVSDSFEKLRSKNPEARRVDFERWGVLGLPGWDLSSARGDEGEVEPLLTGEIDCFFDLPNNPIVYEVLVITRRKKNDLEKQYKSGELKRVEL